jgi:hypothetical protein
MCYHFGAFVGHPGRPSAAIAPSVVPVCTACCTEFAPAWVLISATGGALTCVDAGFVVAQPPHLPPHAHGPPFFLLHQRIKIHAATAPLIAETAMIPNVFIFLLFL